MKVALYCRLSEEDRNKTNSTDDSESIQNQKSMLVQYAVNNQWEIYDIYSDDDYTGADRNRPAFNRLINDAQARKFDIIICKTQSRFTRELEIVEKYIHGLFPIWGIRFISIVDNADTDLKGNKKSRQINALVNEWYLEDMSESIKSVLDNKREQGLFIGSFALYGYLKDPNQKGHLIIDEEAAQVVREVYRLYADGHGKETIARILNDRGIPNPTEYKNLKGHAHRQSETHSGTLWRAYAISDMLTNEMYIGNMVQGKYGSVSYKTKANKPRPKDQWIIVENTHEPIIDRELWDYVQTRVKENYKPFGNGRIGLFSKKAKCLYCGYTMRSSRSKGYYYLKCPTKHVAKDACFGGFVSVSLLTEIVLDELNKIIEQCLNKDEFERGIAQGNRIDDKKERLLNDLCLYEKKLTEYSTAIKSLYIDKTKGLITEDDFILMSQEFYSDRERVQKSIDDVNAQIQVVDKQMHVVDDKEELLKQYMNVTELNREMVDKLIDCIYVGKRDRGGNEIPVEIHWNF